MPKDAVLMSETPWCSIRATSDVAEIDITGVIGFDYWEDEEDKNNTVNRLQKELKNIANLKVNKIIVNIDSMGGSVSHGLHMHDILASHKANVITRSMGMTASAATIIHQAGDTREISDNSLYLIHQAWDTVSANVNELETHLEEMKNVNTTIKNIYIKAGANAERVEELFNTDNGNGLWITAQEALDAGLADSIYEAKELSIAAMPKADVLKKLNLPEVPLNKIEMPKDKAEKTFLELLDELKAFAGSIFTKKEDGGDEPTVEIPQDVQDKLTAFEQVVADHEQENKDLKATNEALESDKVELEKNLNEKSAELQDRIKALETEVAKANAASTTVDGPEGKENADKIIVDKELEGLNKDAQKIKDYYGEPHGEVDEDPEK